jgi:hypothetical protein
MTTRRIFATGRIQRISAPAGAMPARGTLLSIYVINAQGDPALSERR